MRRREVIAGLAGAAATAWPLATRAQPRLVPIVKFLSGRSRDEASGDTAAFLQGLNEMGYVADRNVALEYRWAEGRNELLPDLAADLVRRQVTVLAAVGGNNSALAAKRATATIPIVFTSSADPVLVGLVASLSQPGGNVTGVSWFDAELGPKQLKLMSEIVPNVAVIALMVNPQSPELTQQRDSAQQAALALGLQLHVVEATSTREIEVAFIMAKQQGVNALMISSDPFLHSRRKQIVALAAQHAIPMISGGREWVAAGGLVSYGNSIPDAYRRAGLQTGRLLRGVKPNDLPVDRSTRFELAINLTTAKALGLTVPDKLHVAADEVIE
jgi:putative tryptophan/tyrosine transport system substrate-binding protein